MTFLLAQRQPFLLGRLGVDVRSILERALRQQRACLPYSLWIRETVAQTLFRAVGGIDNIEEVEGVVEKDFMVLVVGVFWQLVVIKGRVVSITNRHRN